MAKVTNTKWTFMLLRLWRFHRVFSSVFPENPNIQNGFQDDPSTGKVWWGCPPPIPSGRAEGLGIRKSPPSLKRMTGHGHPGGAETSWGHGGGGGKPTHTPWKTKMTIGKIPISNRKYTSSSCYFSMGYQVLVRQNSNPQTPHQESTSAHGVDSPQGNRRNGTILGSHFHLFCILFLGGRGVCM